MDLRSLMFYFEAGLYMPVFFFPPLHKNMVLSFIIMKKTIKSHFCKRHSFLSIKTLYQTEYAALPSYSGTIFLNITKGLKLNYF